MAIKKVFRIIIKQESNGKVYESESRQIASNIGSMFTRWNKDLKDNEQIVAIFEVNNLYNLEPLADLKKYTKEHMERKD